MKRILYITILILALGGIMSSCVKEEVINGSGDGGSAKGSEGDVAISFVLCTDEMTPHTRAGKTYMDFAQESAVKDVCVILYGEDGKAAYIRHYRTDDTDQWHSISPPRYQTKAFMVEDQDYEVAVLVNYGNIVDSYINFDPGLGTSISHLTGIIGHEKEKLTDVPLNLALLTNVRDYQRKAIAVRYLTGSYAPQAYYSADFIKNNYRFFMSNADGLLSVTRNMLHQTSGEAENAPIELDVERAVAKVSFMRKADAEVEVEGLPDNARITDQSWFMRDYGLNQMPADDLDLIRWRTDRFSLKTYIMRKGAPIAPNPQFTQGATGGNMETSQTDHRDRYATDPAFVNLADKELFTIPGDSDDPALKSYIRDRERSDNSPPLTYIGLPLRVADGYDSGNMIDLENDSYDHFEYVTENTCDTPSDRTQLTQVIVRVPIMVYYPIKSRNDKGIGEDAAPCDELTGEYVVYDGKLYPLSELAILLDDKTIPSQRPGMAARVPACYVVKDYPLPGPMDEADRLPIQELKDYVDGLTPEQKQELLDNIDYSDVNHVDIIVKAVEGKTIHNVKFYKGGMNYFRVPIRHFSDAQTTPGGYGYYGVVRNNAYIMLMTKISGFGNPSPILSSAPAGRSATVAAEEGGLEVESRTTDWYGLPGARR